MLGNQGKGTDKCAKCGITSKENSSLTFHRFPLPSMQTSTTTLKARVWAKYCFPDEDWSTYESLLKLHKKHKMICSNHFDDSSFTSSARTRLNKFAIPTEAQNILVMLRNEPDQEEQEIQKLLEVCVDSLESARNAIAGGADELEVCSSLTEGGLTPSAGLVKKIIEEVKNHLPAVDLSNITLNTSSEINKEKVKVNVMIRCRTGSDFCFTKDEIETMLSDIEILKSFGVDRFVFGALTEEQRIDEASCARVVEKAHPIPLTFHRAFDVCNDPIAAIETIIGLGFSRLLTSGQRDSVNDSKAFELIRTLQTRYGDKIDIMPGAGVNADNCRQLTNLGCKIVHSSCKTIRYLPVLENSLSMGTSDSEYIYVADKNIVTILKDNIT